MTVIFSVAGGLLLAAAWLAAGRWVRSDEFRRFIEHQISAELRAAEVRVAPLRWQGRTVSSAGLSATGSGGADAGRALARVSAETLAADWQPRALWRGAWRLDELRVGRATVVLGDDGRARSLLPAPAPRASGQPSAGGWGLLPTRFEVGRVRIENFSLAWDPARPDSEGSVRNVALEAVALPDGKTWAIAGRGGRFSQAGVPALALDALQLHATARELRITEVRGRPETGGTVRLTGTQQLDGDRTLDLRARFEGVPAAPFLPEDWRARLRGIASGDLRVTGPAEDPARLAVTGRVELRDGLLEALPILGDLAFLGVTERFRRMPLRQGTAAFSWTRERLEVTELRLAGDGALRVEGSFGVSGGQIAGTLLVGVPRAALRWLPGASSRVFDLPERDGYAWTTLQLSGPANAPREDLTPRLLAAAGDEALDTVRKSGARVRDTVRDLWNALRRR